MASEILVNIGSGSDLLSDGTKPLPETILMNYLWPSDNHLKAISQEAPQPPITKVSLKNNLSKNFIQTSLGSKSHYSPWFGTIQTFHNSCCNVPWLTDWLIDWSLFPLIQTRSTIIWIYNMKQKLWKTMWIRVTQITQWNRNRTKGLFVFAGHVFIRIQWLYIHNVHSNMTTHIDMLKGIYIHSHTYTHVHIYMDSIMQIHLIQYRCSLLFWNFKLVS